MQKYEIVLKNDKIKSYNRLAIFIFILNAAAIIYFLYTRYEKISQNNYGLIAVLALIFTIFIYILLSVKKKKELAFLFSVIGVSLYWILIGYWWIGLIMVILFYLYSITKRQLKISIADKIIYPSFPKRIIKWDELNNVILKDGLLTIDFKNNKIIQQLIKFPNLVNEKEFNDFCREQLKSAASV
jgi:hypothetical protein